MAVPSSSPVEFGELSAPGPAQRSTEHALADAVTVRESTARSVQVPLWLFHPTCDVECVEALAAPSRTHRILDEW